MSNCIAARLFFSFLFISGLTSNTMTVTDDSLSKATKESDVEQYRLAFLAPHNLAVVEAETKKEVMRETGSF